MRNPEDVPSVSQVVKKLRTFKGFALGEISRITGVKFSEKLGHKGCVGHFIEDVAGIPRGNDRLDFTEVIAELKSKLLSRGAGLSACVIGSINSLPEEMVDEDVSFEDSVIGQKCFRMVIVTVCSNRGSGGPAGEGWEKFTLETVNDFHLLEMPEWEGVKEDWEYLKRCVREAARGGYTVSCGTKGPNDYLCFNPSNGSFRYKGEPLRKSGGGLQLALGATLMRRLIK